MAERAGEVFELICPCCGSRLGVDAALGKVIAHQPPPSHAKTPDLGRATKLLEKEAERREALFKQSAEDEKVKARVLERKFEEALKKSKDEPFTPPVRDIDLD